MKKLILAGLISVMAAGSVMGAAVPGEVQTNKQAVIEEPEIIGMPNPYVEYKTIAELEKVLGFEIKLPQYISAGYKLSDIIGISSKTADIRWKKGEAGICYRMMQGSGDISGDYTKYKTISYADMSVGKVVLKGNGSKVYLALWEKDGMTHALSASQGMSKKEIKRIIKSCK